MNKVWDRCRKCGSVLPTGYMLVQVMDPEAEEYIRHRIKRCPLCGVETWL